MKDKSILFFICLLLISLERTSSQQNISNDQQPNINLDIKDDGSFHIKPTSILCPEILNYDNLSKAIRSSIMDLSIRFKINVNRYNKKLQNNKRKASIQMQIISAYLDELTKVTKLIRGIKNNFKGFIKNGCNFDKNDLKSVYVSDKLIKSLVKSLRKHVKKVKSPFKHILNSLR